jgi:predicted enzyme related to lactoylglutathione lyase
MAKSKQPSPKPGIVCWNELLTSSVPKAKKFYGSLLGWKTRPFGKGLDYTIIKNAKGEFGGMMHCPKPGSPAQWIPYVFVLDVDAKAKKTVKLGGEILVAPFDVKGAGRIAVLADPQGAAFGVIRLGINYSVPDLALVVPNFGPNQMPKNITAPLAITPPSRATGTPLVSFPVANI